MLAVTCPLQPLSHLLLVASLLSALSGCSGLPSMRSGGPDSSTPEALRPTASAVQFQKMQQARHQNAVVLQVVGDSEPFRVLPLPGEDQPVFVSTLLKQSGVAKRFSRMEVELYRSGAVGMEEVRMGVRFNDRGQIDPATDYALRAGDRLRVAEDHTSVGDLLESILPSNAWKAATGGRF
jgi:hypothetical protein